MKIRRTLVALLSLASAAWADNPVAKDIYTADPTARAFGDRIYLYATHDNANAKYWDTTDWRLLSTDDLKTWKDHGAFFDLKGFAWAKQYAWAPECVRGADGKYYAFLPVDRTKIGVAVADAPEGPFKDAIGGPLVDNAVQTTAGPEPIDPSVFTDDDGQAYLYFGCRQPKVVKLDALLTKLAGEITGLSVVDAEGKDMTLTEPGKQPPLPAGFGEAPFVFKHNGTYYFVYSNGWARQSTVVYATAKSPTGPFTYVGPVMERADSVTQHASVVPFKGKWYLFYHTQAIPGGSTYSRAVCAEELTFDADGKIIPAKPTKEGPKT